MALAIVPLAAAQNLASQSSQSSQSSQLFAPLRSSTQISTATSKNSHLSVGQLPVKPLALRVPKMPPSGIVVAKLFNQTKCRNPLTAEGFGIHSSGEGGIRTVPENSLKTQLLKDTDAKSGAVGAQPSPNPPNSTQMKKDCADLADVIAAWGQLPEAVRAGITAMVRAVAK
jgi:hypothetical protein